ncbi:GNAT family N-acetyltransferase [Lederbergia citri]|uniref:GNAT family N-acetyltransferase n=1 Tax=Lederbergia citri TaxID=2833580 RepID=A0A942TEZ5_9BACI|nr:GNAT family N-acetyltransferase [Lederbergia citri]MBS4196695.1 GNAT family N-acetyltransferase [Lederbergia citri]
MQSIMIEKFQKKDFDDYFKLVSDERVMAQITERAIALEEAKVNFYKILERNEKYDFYGSFKIYDQITNQFIGLGHLTLNEIKEDEAEIGYMIRPEFWGKGYGSTVAKRLFNMAKQTEIKLLKAIIDPNNIASRKILINLGFISMEICEIDGLPGEILSKEL